MKRNSTFAAIPRRKQLANLLFPHSSRLLDQVNNNALVKWIKQHASIPVFSDRVELAPERRSHQLFGIWSP
jgi:hypothetical protein